MSDGEGQTIHPDAVAEEVREAADVVVVHLEKELLGDIRADDELDTRLRRAADKTRIDEVDASAQAAVHTEPRLRGGDIPDQPCGDRNGQVAQAGAAAPHEVCADNDP